MPSGMVRNAKRKPRQCAHCHNEYTPVGNSQKWCESCLGPVVITQWGNRYPHAHRLKRYGVSYPEWLAMLYKFDGLCWICKSSGATDIDHDHDTGKVRGALCTDCNTSLHYVERPGWFESAIKYLAGDF